MSCVLPPEILDLIIDHLHDERAALKACCVASKSWVPRTRSHLFAHVEFDVSKAHVKLWEKTFPDPSKSPAHHTRELFVDGIHGTPVISVVGAGVGSWIQAFSNVVHLEFSRLDQASLIPFHGLSPAVRSLRLDHCTAEVFDLVCSFPLLEDLALINPYPERDAGGWTAPSTSPRLTGSLDLLTFGVARFTTRRLLDLSGGLHFYRINMMFTGNDEAKSVTDLVSSCSDTLESLTLRCYLPDAHRTVFVNLSKTTKLKHLNLLWTDRRLTVQWITTTLRTVESRNLQSIAIYASDNIPGTIEEEDHQEWKDLDRLLVQFWTSHSIRPQVLYAVGEGGRDLRGDAPSLLPEVTRRGLVDLVEITSYDYVAVR